MNRCNVSLREAQAGMFAVPARLAAVFLFALPAIARGGEAQEHEALTIHHPPAALAKGVKSGDWPGFLGADRRPVSTETGNQSVA